MSLTGQDTDKMFEAMQNKLKVGEEIDLTRIIQENSNLKLDGEAKYEMGILNTQHPDR